MSEWPDWWSWELELSPHVLKRMVDRGFSEAALRLMLEDASGYDEDVEPGRWKIHARQEGRDWIVIVEPLTDEQILLVITAYAFG